VGGSRSVELKIEHLTKRYGSVTALENFSVTLRPGIYGLLGANGAGKSTLINLLTDNIKRSGGIITFDGEEIIRMGERFRALLGYMPQQQGIYENMTARSFVSYIGRLKGLRGAALREQVERLLRLTSLEEVQHKKLGSFSGGMKQRALLAQALLGSPKVLLLDEPTAGLDPKERIRVRNYIKALAEDRIVLLATHIVSDVESIANQVLLMKGGRLVGMDTPQKLVDSVPNTWEPVQGRMSLEDVYLYYLGEDCDGV